jgi:3',5'-cyclic AMP phosphodiesterase CpdA
MECRSIKYPPTILPVLLAGTLFFAFACNNGNIPDQQNDNNDNYNNNYHIDNPAYYDPANDRVFWFIQISDIHIGTNGDQDSQNLNWLVTEARQAIHPTFIMASGDLTDSTNGNPLGWPDGPYQEEWDEYRSIVDIPGITEDNYYEIPGNHEAYNDASFAYYLANSVQGRATGNTQVSFFKEFVFGKYHFLGVNTAGNTGDSFSLSSPYGDPAGLDADELDFMTSETNYDPGDPPLLTLVFGHHPLFATDDPLDTYVYYGLEEFLALMDQADASLYGYGHTHSFEEAFFIPNNSQQKGFFYFNTASMGKSTENQFTIIAIDCNGLSSKTGTVDSWPIAMITTPLDAHLSGFNHYAYTVPAASSNPIRALVFEPDPDDIYSVQYRIDGASQWSAMSRVPSNPNLWESVWNATSLAPGQHTIEVEAASASGIAGDLITVSVE